MICKMRKAYAAHWYVRLAVVLSGFALGVFNVYFVTWTGLSATHPAWGAVVVIALTLAESAVLVWTTTG